MSIASNQIKANSVVLGPGIIWDDRRDEFIINNVRISLEVLRLLTEPPAGSAWLVKRHLDRLVVCEVEAP